MKATFENSVNVLVMAYFSGFLEAMSCEACAVGNLVAAAKGYEYSDRHIGIFGPEWKGVQSAWQDVIGIGIEMDEYRGLAKDQIESTGYTPYELMKIEKAFMSKAKTISNQKGDNFNGLMAVVDVLADIHGINLKQKESAKLLFVKS